MAASLNPSAHAQTSSGQTLLLRSPEQHGGAHVWTMCRQQDAGVDGAVISKVGFASAGWSNAIVPGTVLNSLVANGVYPEPYFGLNNAHEQKLIPDISEVGRDFYTYWFRTEFVTPKDFAGRQVWLQFDGINYRAEVWLNGRRLGDLAGMFQRGLFNATDAVRADGTNALAVLVHPVDKPGGFRQKDKTVRAAGENRNGGDGEIGRNTTMLMSVGWDFTFTDGIRDRNTGIWRDVKIFATGPVTLRHAHVESQLPLPALAPARETISVDVINATTQPQSGVLRGRIAEARNRMGLVNARPHPGPLPRGEGAALGRASFTDRPSDQSSRSSLRETAEGSPSPGGEGRGEGGRHTIQQQISDEANITFEMAVSLQPGETKTVRLSPDEFRALNIAEPRLWWPLNKGEQFLYDLTLEFAQDKVVSDRIETRFGIRDIRTDRDTPDQSRQFFVNGRRLFLHGSNWLPEAMCRTSRDRTEAELRYTRQAGINFLRLWGGGVAESDDFYDRCDELGILVWTEFWQTGDTQIQGDRELYRTNVADTIRRLRPHASQAYYVSANERDAKGIIPIADLVQELHPTCEYQVGSETDGIHDGSPYVAENPMFHYEDSASPRGSRINGLCPEYGCPILPTVDCLREMMDEKDLWPINKLVWDYLDGGGFHKMTSNFDRGVQQYGPSAGIEEYAMKAQAFGGLSWRAIWECWNANKFDYGDRFSTGLLFWFHNSPNRQVCGRMWDWSLEPTAALYFTQDAHEPLHAQFDFLKNTVAVNNELPREFTGQLTARVLDFEMREVFRKTVTIRAAAEALVTNAFAIHFPANISPVHFIKLQLEDAKGRAVADTFYWRSDKSYQRGRTWTGPQFEGFESLARLPKVKLDSAVKWSRENDESIAAVTVRNPSKSLAFMTWLRLQHTADAKPVRPAFYDDNFFSLLPGESRSVRIAFGNRAADPKRVQLLVDGWNVERQTHAVKTGVVEAARN